MLDYVSLAFDCVFLVLFFVIYRALRFDPQDIITTLQKSEAGVSSGTARQKKAADAILGQAMLEQYPIVKFASEKYPPLGDFMQKYPNMVPYLASQATSIIGGLSEKMIPEQLQGLLQGFLGGQQPAKPQAPARRRSTTGYD